MRASRWGRLAFAALLFFAAAAEAREVSVGVYDNPPKVFLGERQEPSGILIDLLRRIAGAEGWTLRFVPCAWRACLDAVEQGRIDLLPDVAYSDERDNVLDFHQSPALYSWSLVYRRRDVTINSVFDLKDKRIAVLNGSIQRDYFAGLLKNSGIRVSFVPVATLSEGFDLVSRGGAETAIANKYFGDRNAENKGLRDTPIVFQPVKLFYATGSGRDSELLQAIDRHLGGWQADPQSFYFDVLRRWQDGPQPRISSAVWGGLGGAGLLLLSALGAAGFLRREVSIRTRELREREQSLRIAATVFQSQEAMFVTGPDCRVIEANQAFTEMTGYRADELPDRTIPAFTLEESVLDQREAMWEAAERTGRWQAEVWTRRQGGEHYAAWLTITAVRAPGGETSHFVGTQTDITERKLVQDQATRLAFYDALTNLPNRRLLLDRIAHALALGERGKRFGALLFIDLDNFKDLNDTLGHEVGDQFLQQVAQRLVRSSRQSDTIARLGGDEFVILMEDMGATEAAAMAQCRLAGEKVLAAINQPYLLAAGSRHTSCSIGVAVFEGRGLSAQDLLRRGDLAMYQAKKEGRNTLCFFRPEMESAVTFRTGLESDLRESLRRGELFLHYQPQFDLQQRMVGVEALLRWRHPVRGMVPPGLFIPVAEASGLILTIGDWVLEQACRQLIAWSAAPATASLQMAVNVSARQFRHPDFTAQVSALIRQTGVNASRLKIELTETMMIEDIEDTVAKMLLLKGLGVCFALDDFGTGYSSLSYLKRLPIDQLKIDQSFVADLLTDPNDAAIARSVVALGNALGLGIIAEGVETAEQRDFLAAIGCTTYQGYFFARPGPVEAIEALLAPASRAAG
ncbi:MAG: EAL domain-containing protein [Noviherbaspirillum sp.]